MLASCFVEKVLKCNHAELSLEQNPVATNQAVTRLPSRKCWARSGWAPSWAPHLDSCCSSARRSLSAASEIAKYFAWPFNLQTNWFLNNGKCYLFIYDISERLLDSLRLAEASDPKGAGSHQPSSTHFPGIQGSEALIRRRLPACTGQVRNIVLPAYNKHTVLCIYVRAYICIWVCVWKKNIYIGLPKWLSGKEFAANAEDTGSILESGRYPREGNGNPLQCSCPENPTDRGAGWATVHGVAKESDTT